MFEYDNDDEPSGEDGDHNDSNMPLTYIFSQMETIVKKVDGFKPQQADSAYFLVDFKK